MKLLNVILFALLTLCVYASNVSVTAQVLDATDVNAKIKVVVTNTATPTNLSVTATVNYQRFGFDEEAVSLPVSISIMHPITVRSINLSFPLDWLLLTPFSPVVLNDGQTLDVTLEYGKVSVKL